MIPMLATFSTPVSCFAYSSTLKVEATCSFETSVDFQRTTLRFVPEDRTLPVLSTASNIVSDFIMNVNRAEVGYR
jgi:hypothetical protein